MISVDAPRDYEPSRGLYMPESAPLVCKPGAYLPPRERKRVRQEAAQLGPRGAGGNGLLGASAGWLPSMASVPLAAWYRYNVGLSTVDTTLADSNAFSAWTQTNVTPTSGQTDPLGGSNAWRLAETVSGTAAHNLRHAFSNQGTNCLMKVSFYAKPNGRSWVWAGDNTPDRVFFNVTSGTVGATPGSGVRSPTITSAGNGWYLCSYYVKATSANLDIGIGNADNSLSYAGDGTSGILLYTVDLYQRRLSQWSDQSGNARHAVQATDGARPFYEVGKGVTFVRAAQSRLAVASGAPSGAAAHSFFALSRLDEASGVYQGIIGLGDQPSNTSGMGSDGSNSAWFGGANLGTPVGTVLSAGTRYRIGKTAAVGTTQGYLNGATNGPTAPHNYPASSTMYLGTYDSNGANVGNWTTIELVVYSGVLSAQDLSSLDSYLQAVSAQAA